jgi:hypothetical protein
MVTVLAVIVPLDDDPLTLTQSPAAAEEDATVATWEKVVVAVQLTVTWPLCWFWTSMDEPEMAATEPEAPGNEPPPGAVAASAMPAKAKLAARETPSVAASTDRRQGVCGDFMVCCSPSSSSSSETSW